MMPPADATDCLDVAGRVYHQCALVLEKEDRFPPDSEVSTGDTNETIGPEAVDSTA